MMRGNRTGARAPEARVSSEDKTLSALMHDLDRLPSAERGAAAIRIAAALIEYGAFELAERLKSRETGELINLAAALQQYDPLNRRTGVRQGGC
ncbi:hypothetical protein [Roseobacter ponti]|uniref:Uncharacterized protein n=1 Tax=Roseobacter ponti TaxID=1891787 RepID=A0A858SUS6_9RHOB|nr:hypothetical protein [Roseobacter ponti]QJF51433.1 hypothetical protein G3256_09800 [Roseobacter ponti]